MEFLSFFIVYFIILFIYGIVLYFVLLKSKKIKRQKKRFYCSIVNIQKHISNIDLSYDQLLINYRNIFQRSDIKYLVRILETYITDYDRLYDNYYEKKYDYEKDGNIRKFILEFMNKLNEQFPFSSINEKEASILKSIKDHIKSEEKEIIINLLNDLSTEIKVRDEKLEKANRDNKIAILLSIIGIFLTILFGILSFNLK